MKKIFFITGTDTEVGKTTVSCALLQHFRQQNLSTVAVKPIASGGYYHQQQLVNADAIKLQSASTIKLPYQQVNPFCFEPAIAPHLAAQQANQTISQTALINYLNEMMSMDADILIIEGAGGWRCPINSTQTYDEVISALKLPVILVSAIRLGCINHTLLTHQSIAQSGAIFHGWIANNFSPSTWVDQQNISTIDHHVKPLLAHLASGQFIIHQDL